MNFILKLQNFGVHQNLTLEETKRIKVVNTMTLITIGIITSILIYSIVFNLELILITTFLAFLITIFFPLILNAYKYYYAAILLYIIESVLELSTLTILFGPSFHYHYFLFAIMGMSIVFVPNSKKHIKYILSSLCLATWIYLEFHVSYFSPIYPLNTEYINIIRIINNILLFVVMFVLIMKLEQQNEKHVLKIEKQHEKLDNMEEFTHTVTHDLKSPISNIVGLLNYIHKDYKHGFDKNLKETFELIKTSTEHLNVLIDSILAYTKVGKETIDISSFEVNALIKQVLQFQSIPPSVKVIVPTKKINVVGVKTQLEQVLTNLISNAIKYNDKPKGEIEIYYKELNADYLIFKIRDNGAGIPTRMLHKVFDIFVTAHGNKRDDSTGVGLSIVKKIIEKNNGEIGVKSILHKGSIFWFTWPLVRMNLSDDNMLDLKEFTRYSS